MKKLIGCLMMVAGLTGFAGIDDVVVTFSTKGPDTYADGRTVVDGEYYALVWTPNGSTFGGIDANGAALGNSKVVMKLAIAKGGRCPSVLFQVDKGYADAKFPGGTWAVCLLDTRTFETDSNGAYVLEGGLPKVASCGGKFVNGFVRIASAGGEKINFAGESAQTQNAATGFKIKDCKLIGNGLVQITVAGSLSTQQYSVLAGGSPDALAESEVCFGKTGEDLIIVKPVKDGGEFFGVQEK